MEIVFSRHAKRRAKLYKITLSAIENQLIDLKLENGNHNIISEIAGFNYPIKIVVFVEGNTLTVITNYPLKKGRNK